MRKLAFIVAAIGALAVTAPAYAAGSASGSVPMERVVPASSKQADEFSSYRRHWRGHRHWRGDRYWRGHRHWYGPRFYGPRCRSVWRPHRGWVRICRW
ncbi:MAG: hypothetical protein RO009_12670 [Pseudorhodoplanes sp.]|jgi:hypothetical protein|nr:hypothetical protein [Pseudorhodoplanes sp.]